MCFLKRFFMQNKIIIKTTKKYEAIDITDKVREKIKQSEVKDGVCLLFAVHATAAIVINESWDPEIGEDLLEALSKLIPEGKWRHDRVDNNAAAHIKAAILGPSETILVKNGELVLGRWQNIFFVELDGPRERREVLVEIK